MHLFKLGLPHASCCQVKGRRLLKALFPNQTIRENKMNSAFVTMRFRSSRYAGETLSPRDGCLYESGNEDWGEEITEEICFWNVYTRPFLLAVWKMLRAKWRASWRLSLNWWLLRFCGHRHRSRYEMSCMHIVFVLYHRKKKCFSDVTAVNRRQQHGFKLISEGSTFKLRNKTALGAPDMHPTMFLPSRSVCFVTHAPLDQAKESHRDPFSSVYSL